MSKAPYTIAALAMIVVASQGCELSSDGRGGLGGGGDGGTGFGGGVAGVAGTGFGGVPAFDASVGGAGSGGGLCGLCPPPPPSMVSAFVSPCCTPSSACGFSAPGLLARDCIQPQRGIRDPTCPAAGTVNSIPMLGCCAVTGMCGIALDALGLGCVARADLSPFGVLSFNDQTVDIACFSGVVDAGPGAEDAGADDAGDPLCAWAITNYCDPVASCHADNGLPACKCPNGYADLSNQGERGRICRDVNECLLGASVCDGGTCVNSAGGFTCNN